MKLRPLEPVSVPARIGLGIAFFVLFFAAWGWATLGGYVSKTFLADPITMVHEGWLEGSQRRCEASEVGLAAADINRRIQRDGRVRRGERVGWARAAVARACPCRGGTGERDTCSRPFPHRLRWSHIRRATAATRS